MKFEDVKIRFPRLAEDINNVLLRYDNRILPDSIKGYCYGIHTLNGELHNSDGTRVIFECSYKRSTFEDILEIHLYYNKGRLHRKFFPAVVIPENRNLYEEKWIDGKRYTPTREGDCQIC
jgi:hypothetical protein